MPMADLTSALQLICGDTVEISKMMQTQTGQCLILFYPPTWEPRPTPEKGEGVMGKVQTMVKADTPFEAMAMLVDHVKNPRPQDG